MKREMWQTARRGVLAALAIAVLILAAACGGGGGGGNQADQGGGGAPGGGNRAAVGDPTAGRNHFRGVCATCHGPDGKGIPGLGKDLTTSEWVAEQSDEELVEFIKVGRRADHPLNTTGIDMPPKGGNPNLTDDDIRDIVAYLRQIHTE